MNSTTIAVDLSKNVFEIAVSDQPGRVRERHRVSRERLVPFFAERRPATVLFEACGSAHHWGRRLGELGHSVVLLPPHCVRPYVTRNKTDRADAKGILEAYRNAEIRPVPVKTIEQQTLVALHRMRYAWMADRTGRINTVRGLLREFGLVIPVGADHVLPRVAELLEDADSGVPDPLRPALAEAAREIRGFERQIKDLERQLQALARQMPAVTRLLTIPGFGLITATAFVAFIGDVRRFPSGRHLASYLGITPRERSSGLVRRLGMISKRGDSYLRMLLTHGARAVLRAAKNKEHPDRLRAWALDLERRRGHNRATIALANKLARIGWAVWLHDRNFELQETRA